jgi:hypothetical protein
MQTREVPADDTRAEIRSKLAAMAASLVLVKLEEAGHTDSSTKLCDMIECVTTEIGEALQLYDSVIFVGQDTRLATLRR